MKFPSLFRKRITEQKAAQYFVQCISSRVDEYWPSTSQALRQRFAGKWDIPEESIAKLHLLLAALSQDLQALKNLFPPPQAQRLERHVLALLEALGDMADYAVIEVQEYSLKFQNDLNTVDGDPLSAISARLLHRWLGSDFQICEGVIDGKGTGCIDTLTLMLVMEIVGKQCGFWKAIKDTFKIVEDTR